MWSWGLGHLEMSRLECTWGVLCGELCELFGNEGYYVALRVGLRAELCKLSGNERYCVTLRSGSP